MRITKKTILAMGLIASSLTLNSCDYNDNNEVLRRPTALVTVYPSAPDGFFMQLDDSTSRYLGGILGEAHGLWEERYV